jgi:hypothetical protein
VALQGKVRWSKQRRGSLHSQAFQKRARERRNSAANRTSKTCMCYQAFDPTEYRYRCNHSSKLVPLGPRSASSHIHFRIIKSSLARQLRQQLFLETRRGVG